MKSQHRPIRAIHVAAACGLVLTVGLWRAVAQHHHEPADTHATTRAVLSVPPAMHAEHEILHRELEAAVAAGGKTAEAARQVEAVLMPHFTEEEAYAMPPLSLLQVIANGHQPTAEQKAEAIRMTDKLRAHHAQMLKEHEAIAEALDHLAAAAREENKPQQAEFAKSLSLHAQNEEQILYPAALVLGDYLKLRAPHPHH